VLAAVVGFDLVFLALPTLLVLIASFTAGAIIDFPPDGLSLRWYGALLEQPAFTAAFWRSLEVALVCTAISLPAGTLAALALARYRLRCVPGVITGSLIMFILAFNEFIVSLLLTDARIVTLPVLIYNSIRSILTPDLAAVSVVYIVIALATIWLLDRLVGLDVFLRSR
jgi:ABC-type spermidine/putrescine transport system permease subunit II